MYTGYFAITVFRDGFFLIAQLVKARRAFLEGADPIAFKRTETLMKNAPLKLLLITLFKVQKSLLQIT